MSGVRSVLLADDHPIFRHGLRQAIEADPSFTVVSEVGDGEAALAQIGLLRPDYALFDLSMPRLDGFSALERLKETGTSTRVLIVSMHTEAGYARRAQELGAIGIVAKEDAASELIRALTAPDETFFMSQSIGRADLNPPLNPSAALMSGVDLEALTASERKVLQMLSKGLTSKQIAQALDISPRTVQAHRRNISEKFGISGPNQLLHLAVSLSTQLSEE